MVATLHWGLFLRTRRERRSSVKVGVITLKRHGDVHSRDISENPRPDREERRGGEERRGWDGDFCLLSLWPCPPLCPVCADEIKVVMVAG